MGRGRAKFRESEVRRVLKAARKAGVHVRVEIRDDEIVATTVAEQAAVSATETLTPDAELERWRRKKKHAP